MVQGDAVGLQHPLQPFKNVKNAEGSLDPAALLHNPTLVDPYEERWLDESDQNLLVVSPYRSREHLLDLHALQESQQLLAKALTALHNIRPDYATCPYTEAFNWSVITDNLRSLARKARYSWTDQHFYIVVFRSQITPTTNRVHLSELDRASHVEAMKSGGLLKYWFGLPDEQGRNLATCRQHPLCMHACTYNKCLL